MSVRLFNSLGPYFSIELGGRPITPESWLFRSAFEKKEREALVHLRDEVSPPLPLSLFEKIG